MEPSTTELDGCLLMAEKLARKYCNRASPWWTDRADDFVQEARIAVLRAWRSFDPGRGLRFSTYAHPSIMTALWRCEGRLRGKLPTIPLDAPLGVDTDTPLEEFLADERVDVAGALLERVEFGPLGQCLALLPPRERLVLDRYFWGGLTGEQIGAELGIGRGSVHLAQKRALTALRGELARRGYGAAELLA